MKNAILVGLLILSVGCSSSGKNANTNTEREPDKVLGRIDEMKERPSWLKESEPFRIENGIVISTGMTTIPADNRVEAAYRIAQNNARGAIAGAIEQRLSFIFQNAEEGTALDSSQTRFIGAEVSQLTTNHIRVSKNYWEKIAETTDTGQRTTKYRVFSLVTMPEPEFKKAIFDAIQKAQGKGSISADFKDKVDKHWNEFVRGPASVPQE